ncbi:pilin [Nocardia sp. XZ_19_369]|uniref:pilin n=1 Tax=Nocardia sp. XZ_19_369 TaxID=2769487 RepID=UPI001E322005|nr:pilin [Nocardia sp. XZ_19_369]
MRITHSPTTPPARPHPKRRGRGRRIVARSTFTLVVSAGVLAAAGAAGAEPTSVLAVAETFDQVLNNLRNWIVGILALIATVCLTVGGTRYLICSGDPGEVERAKIALKAACIGYALAMLAPVVVAVLKSIVGG